MSTVAIKYSELRSAASAADKVANKYQGYYNSLYNTVYKKLSNYSGPSSGHISSAMSNVSSKLNTLGASVQAYKNYANAIRTTLQECKSVDKRVKDNVNNLTAQFKASHGIRNSWIENSINYIMTTFINKTPLGRWLSNASSIINAFRQGIKDKIVEWYNFDGGKESVKGILVACLEIVGGVCAVIGAIVSGGWIIGVIAGVVAGVLAVANGVQNLINEGRGISVARADPALAKRYQKENTIQDTLRGEAIYDPNSDAWYNNVSLWYRVARGIDIVSFACTAVTIVTSCKELVESGLKWANNSAQLSIKDYFSGSSYKNLFTKIKGVAKTKIGDITNALKTSDIGTFRTIMKGIGGEGKVLLGDIAKHFTEMFEGKSGLKDVAKQIKDVSGLAKSGINLISVNIGDGFPITFDTKDEDFGKNLKELIVEDILLESIVVYKPDSMLKIDSEKTTYSWNLFDNSSVGQVQLDVDFDWKLTDFSDPGIKFFDKIVDSKVFKTDTQIMDVQLPQGMLDKLKPLPGAHMSVPMIDIPEFSPMTVSPGAITDAFHKIETPNLISQMPESVKPSVQIPTIHIQDISIPALDFKFFVASHSEMMA